MKNKTSFALCTGSGQPFILVQWLSRNSYGRSITLHLHFSALNLIRIYRGHCGQQHRNMYYFYNSGYCMTANGYSCCPLSRVLFWVRYVPVSISFFSFHSTIQNPGIINKTAYECVTDAASEVAALTKSFE